MRTIPTCARILLLLTTLPALVVSETANPSSDSPPDEPISDTYSASNDPFGYLRNPALPGGAPFYDGLPSYPDDRPKRVNEDDVNVVTPVRRDQVNRPDTTVRKPIIRKHQIIYPPRGHYPEPNFFIPPAVHHPLFFHHAPPHAYYYPPINQVGYYGFGYGHPFHVFYPFRQYSAGGDFIGAKATPMMNPPKGIKRPSNYKPAVDLHAQETKKLASY